MHPSSDRTQRGAYQIEQDVECLLPDPLELWPCPPSCVRRCVESNRDVSLVIPDIGYDVF